LISGSKVQRFRVQGFSPLAAGFWQPQRAALLLLVLVVVLVLVIRFNIEDEEEHEDECPAQFKRVLNIEYPTRNFEC